MARRSTTPWRLVQFGLLFLAHGIHCLFLPNATHLENLLSKYRDEQPHSRTKRAISRSDKEEILMLHNKLRGQVYPSAANMEYMVSSKYNGKFRSGTWLTFMPLMKVPLKVYLEMCNSNMWILAMLPRAKFLRIFSPPFLCPHVSLGGVPLTQSLPWNVFLIHWCLPCLLILAWVHFRKAFWEGN